MTKANYSLLEHFIKRVHEYSLTSRFKCIAGFLAFALILVTTETLLHFHRSEVDSQQRFAALAHASELRARSDRELNAVLFLASGLIGYLEARNDRIDTQEINEILASVFNYGQHIRSFTIAVGYRITYIFPQAGNEAAFRKDYRKIPARWPAVKTSIEGKKGLLTGPVELVQGGTGLIYRISIFTKGRYWGLLSTVIDIPSFQAAAFDGLDNKHFEFAIRSAEDSGSREVMLWGNPEFLGDPETVLLEAEMLSGKWLYAVRAQQKRGNTLGWSIRGLGWLVAFLSGFLS